MVHKISFTYTLRGCLGWLIILSVEPSLEKKKEQVEPSTQSEVARVQSTVFKIKEVGHEIFIIIYFFIWQAISETEQVSFEVADALAQPFPDNKFDLVWSMESGEHMPDKEKVFFISQHLPTIVFLYFYQ